jgi:hypothetical protein
MDVAQSSPSRFGKFRRRGSAREDINRRLLEIFQDYFEDDLELDTYSYDSYLAQVERLSSTRSLWLVDSDLTI